MIKRYFHGTTLENFIKILNKGQIICNRRKKVWKDYSEDAVYLMPEESEHVDRDELFRLTGEQASFAIYQYEHTKRVIIELELEDDLLEDDKDANYAKKIYSSIDIDKIKHVYIEKDDISHEIKKLIALTLLFREENYCNYKKNLRYYEYPNHSVYYMLGVKHIKKIPIDSMYDEDELNNLYLGLLEEIEQCAEYDKYSIRECIEKFNIHEMV